jgi:hypothetical protein
MTIVQISDYRSPRKSLSQNGSAVVIGFMSVIAHLVQECELPAA